MKTIILFAILSCSVCLSCTNKQQQNQTGAAPNEGLPITGGRDTVTNIQVPSEDKKAIAYDTPECYLWYVRDLPDGYKDKPISMWTENAAYSEDVQAINVFVANPTSISLTYGRGWDLERWDGEKWHRAKTKGDIVWFDDGFNKRKAPLLYCFRFPVSRYYHLSKGKYRINKSFSAKREEIKLNAEFEIK